MKKAKILIVDDRPENLLVLESLINAPDIELVKAHAGEEALAKTLDHDLALVLLDVKMPGMDGYEVAELMRGNKSTRNIPIIFVTAEHKEQAHIFKGYDAGAVDYLFKPLEPVILKSKISIFLELYRQKEELREASLELDRRLTALEDLQQQLEEKNEQLLMLSTTDGLTGLMNRRRFDELYCEEWQRGVRNRQYLSILLIDIDHFKVYNDEYGHLVGDECLKTVAKALTKVPRRYVDKVARFGGEEFVVLLPDTDLRGGEELAEKVRESIYALDIEHPGGNGREKRVTVSIGVSSTQPVVEKYPAELLNTADKKLYQAKDAGRNCWASGMSEPQQPEKE